MGCGSASGADSAANSQYTGWETSALNNYNTAMGRYNNQISDMEAQGDPYTSSTFLQNQNKLTSAAMNSEDTQAKQQMQDTAMRTGENTAALNNTIAENARAGQRTMDTYNAAAANENEDKYLQYEQQLAQDQLAGANSEEGMYGENVTGRGNALTNETNADDAEDQMWGNIVSGVAGGAGAAFGGKA